VNTLRFLPDVLRRRQIRVIVEPYTLVGPMRIRNLYNLARRIEHERVPGDVVECGVYNGGTAAVLGHFATRSDLGRNLWLFDSFAGMPEITPEDGDQAQVYVGQLVADPSKVTKVLSLVGADMRRTRLVKGWFQDTFPGAQISQIALLNIDADWYSSVKLCLETFYDRVSPGGYISFDDYGYWPGCRRAVDEFFQNRGLSYQLHEVDDSGRWFQKV
jgi:O-methyltransferase